MIEHFFSGGLMAPTTLILRKRCCDEIQKSLVAYSSCFSIFIRL